MESKQIVELLEKQRRFYQSGATIPVDFRIQQLKKLYAAVKKYENDIQKALFTDLGKSGFEGFMCEIGLAQSEISYMIRHTRQFSEKGRLPLRWHSLPPTAISSRYLTETLSL